MHGFRRKIMMAGALCALWIVFTQGRDGNCAESRYEFGISPSFSSGDYGTGDDVNTFYLPFVFKAYPTGRLRGTLVIPWISQSSTQVTSAGGWTYGMHGMNYFQNPETFRDSSMMMRGSSDVRGSESGLGDIVLRGEYDLLFEPVSPFNLVIDGIVKFPTASESKGLGTGKMDVGFSAEVGRTINNLYYYGRFGYMVVGEPSGADFNNPFLYGGGIGFDVNPDLYLTLSLQGSTSIDNNVDNPLEAVASGDYRLQRDLSLNGYFLLGLSDGSPDIGVGVGFLRKF